MRNMINSKEGDRPAVYSVENTSMVLERCPPLSSWMTDAETIRLNALGTGPAREGFIAAHWLARELAGGLTGTAPARLVVVQSCPTCGGAHGKPTIQGWPGLHVSLSHTHGAVAAAAGWSPVGIDIENGCRAVIDEPVAAQLFSANERRRWEAFQPDARPGAGLCPRSRFSLLIWSAKECLVKLGLLTLDTLNQYDLSALHLPAQSSGEAIALGAFGHAHFFDVSAHSQDIAGVLATMGHDWPSVLKHMPVNYRPDLASTAVTLSR